MPCPDGKHEWYAVNPFVHPTETESDGSPMEIIGARPQSEEEPAWCSQCGALRSKKPKFLGLGGGWGVRHHASDREAPTIANMMRDSERSKRMRAYLSLSLAVISARAFTPMSERAESEISELQKQLWKDMSDMDRMMAKARLKIMKEEWPSDA